ncbi:Na+/H+ antiporter subunit E [Novipirellula galeiformis]|nr:Na+/H+ antiporter subunit E [Novipirellula galeiformis]
MRFMVTLIVLAGLWASLTEASGDSWIVGGPVVLAASLFAVHLASEDRWRWSVMGLFAFGPHFVRSSIVGGIDVAWRSMHPRLPIDPQMIAYPLRLPAGTSRTFFMNVVNLLPGTVSVDVRKDVLSVHVINVNPPVQRELRTLEDAVASMFAIRLNPLGEQGESV